MKQILCVLLAAALCLGLSACKPGKATAPSTSPNTSSSQTAPSASATTVPPTTGTTVPPEAAELLKVDYAGEDFVENGSYIRFVADDSEDSFPFVFYPQEDLKNIRFATVELVDTGYQVVSILGNWDSLTPDDALLIYGSFPGDMSAYYISCEDAAGKLYEYCVTISGMDGSLILVSFP